MRGQIKQIVLKELSPPIKAAARHQITQLTAQDYFAEIRPRHNGWIVWKVFRDLVAGDGFTIPTLRIDDYETQVASEWPIKADDRVSLEGTTTSAPDCARPYSLEMEEWVNQRVRGHFAWADKLADWYADHYRSAFILVYFLSAFGVLTAVLGHPHPWTFPIELCLIAAIVALVIFGGRWHWHERWMEYRLLAELVRQIRIIIPLGGGRPLPRTPIFSGNFEDLSETWMHWHIRAIARSVGIPAVTVTPQYLASCLGYIDGLIESQVNFHRKTIHRYELICENLHSLASSLFFISLAYVSIKVIWALAVWRFGSDLFAIYL